jgi:hemoglobin
MRAETVAPTYENTQPREPSLFDALGGRNCLERVHKRFYDKVFFHHILGAFFADKNRRHQEDQQSDFMAAQFGGPRVYGGRLPDGAHQHMFITEAHFELRHKLLAETLRECGVAQDLRDRWLDIDYGFKNQIVKQTVDQCVKRYTNDRIIVAPAP